VLKLDFGGCKIEGDAPINALANSLCSMYNLKELSAEFFACNISDKAFNNLSHSLYEKPRLRTLALGFGKTKLKEEDTLKNFAKALWKLQKLEELSIVFYKTHFNDKAI
jgi:hypothetical protein